MAKKSPENSKAVVPLNSDQDERADTIIRRYALLGTGAGIIPGLPLNIAALTGIQTKMVYDLAKLYRVPADDQMLRLLRNSLVSSFGSRFVTGTITRLIKAFSPLRLLIGGMSSAAISGMLTAEIGQVYKQHFQAGGQISDLHLSEIQRHIQEQVKAGKFNPGRFASLRGRFGYLYS